MMCVDLQLQTFWCCVSDQRYVNINVILCDGAYLRVESCFCSMHSNLVFQLVFTFQIWLRSVRSGFPDIGLEVGRDSRWLEDREIFLQLDKSKLFCSMQGGVGQIHTTSLQIHTISFIPDSCSMRGGVGQSWVWWQTGWSPELLFHLSTSMCMASLTNSTTFRKAS